VYPLALSFAQDIRPLFRDTPDVDTMKEFGMDLSSCDDVKKHAEAIYERLEDKAQIARFKQWMDEGMAP
jgi:hypothetical protein